MRRLLLASLMGLWGMGCGNDRWVSIPPIMMSCDDLEAEENKDDFEDMMETMVGPGTCNNAGGLQYADDYRCEDGKVQVLCEKS